MRLRGKSLSRDLSGQPCIYCGDILGDHNHSNRSKLRAGSDPGRRAWRICKLCLKQQKSESRDREKDRAHSRQYKLRKWANTLATGCRRRAKDQMVLCDLSERDIELIFEEQSGRCFWFGVPLSPSDNSKALDQPSIDRLDPKGPYTKKNVVISCYFANIGRRDNDTKSWATAVDEIKKAIGN